MAWNDPTELVVASAGEIYTAPVGTALPVSPVAALNAAFVGLGFTTEDGVGFKYTPQVQEFMAWQSKSPVRRELTGYEVEVSFALEQWNETNVPLAFGGGTVINLGGGIFRFNLPDDNAALAESAMVIDAADGTRHMRFVIPRGNVTDAVETKFVRKDMAVLPITFKGLQPTDLSPTAYFLTDDALAFAAGS